MFDNEKISFSQLLNIIMTVSLSDRINRLQTSKTIEISDLARNLLSEGRNVISLSQGEPDFETPDHIKEAGINAIKEGFTRYSNVDGMPLLKQAICKKFLNYAQTIACLLTIVKARKYKISVKKCIGCSYSRRFWQKRQRR